MRQIAIVGAGASGCYLASQLLRDAKDAQIVLIDHLHSPFGLVRYGVAPDHQGTKGISRLLSRGMSDERVGFFGNVKVGRDVSLDDLLEWFDAVVLATGASQARLLGVPGESLPGSLTSAEFVGWYNDHPDHPLVQFDGVRSAVIIGNGNVAIDVIRVLAKNAQELEGSDLSPEVFEKLQAQPLEAIHIIGRSSPDKAKFTQEEIVEIGRLARAHAVIVDSEEVQRLQQEGKSNPVLEVLAGFGSIESATEIEKPIKIHFHFGLNTAEFLGEEKLEAIRFTDQEGQEIVLPAQLAVTCIGYSAVPCSSLEPSGGFFENDAGCIQERLYTSGWAARGPSGTIPTNRKEAKILSKKMAAEIEDGNRPGRVELEKALASRSVRSINYADWQRLDQLEQERAGSDRVRLKFKSIEQALSDLD